MVPMGKVEKIVVLSVLFLITLILVVSLSSTPEDPSRAQTGTNLARVPAGVALPGTARPAARNPAPGSTTALAAEREAARPGTLLDSSVAAEPRASAPDTTPAPVTTPAPAPAADLPQGQPALKNWKTCLSSSWTNSRINTKPSNSEIPCRRAARWTKPCRN
jgi:hypothetical protein